MPAEPAPAALFTGSGRRAPRGLASVAAASMVANALGYALTLVAARWLGPDQFGAFAALLGLLVVGHVVPMGVQTTTARHVALAADAAGRQRAVQDLATVGTTAAALVFGVGAAAAWPLAWFLHLDSAAGPLMVAVALVPLTWLGLLQGQAQGSHANRRLAVLLLAAAVGKSAGGVLGAWAGSATAAITGVALGCTVVAVLSGLGLGERPRVDLDRLRQRGPEAAHAAHALLAFFVLVNVDVMLARHYLPAAAAGTYAVGAVIAKIAFWLPQSVGLVAFPHLANPSTRDTALKVSLALLACVGLGVTVAAALLGGWLVLLIGGEAYAGLASSAWIFAAIGAAQAVAQLLLLDRLAQEDRLAVVAVWTAVAALVGAVAVATGTSLAGIAATTLAVTIAVAASQLLARRGHESPLRSQP